MDNSNFVDSILNEEESKTINEKVMEKKKQTQQLLIRNSGVAAKTAAGGFPLQKNASVGKIVNSSGGEISKGLSNLKMRKTQGMIPEQIHHSNN
jgi:hypothetical protein